MNEIPFINLPPNMGWGSKYIDVWEYYKTRNTLVLDRSRNGVICINGVYEEVKFIAYLSFESIFCLSLNDGILTPICNRLRKLKSIILDIGDGKNFEETYKILVKFFGEPSVHNGISIDELNSLVNINLSDVETLPYFEWSIGSSRLVHRFVDHWGVAQETVLRPM